MFLLEKLIVVRASSKSKKGRSIPNKIKKARFHDLKHYSVHQNETVVQLHDFERHEKKLCPSGVNKVVVEIAFLGQAFS